MKRQSPKRIEKLIQSYPAIGFLLGPYGLCTSNLNVDIRVQRADPDTIHLQAKNLSYYDRAYVMHEDGYRGTREQSFVVVDKNHDILKTLSWERGDYEMMSRTAFAVLDDPDLVEYALWVTESVWYSEPEDEDEIFGKDLISIDVDIIVYRRPVDMTFWELVEQADKLKFEREDAQNHPPKVMPELPGIAKALATGCKLHAFLSGGGLRVVRLERKDALKGYGEHPDVSEALLHTSDDYLAGGRPYDEVYGKECPHYLTGSTLPASNLDAWLRQGRTFKAWQEGHEVVFQLSGYGYMNPPDDVVERAKAGETVRWRKRGYTMESSPYQFASGEWGCSTRPIKSPKGRSSSDSHMYEITKTGRGADFWKAMLAAFEAPEVEVTQN